jgi:hypothetical protein
VLKPDEATLSRSLKVSGVSVVTYITAHADLLKLRASKAIQNVRADWFVVYHVIPFGECCEVRVRRACRCKVLPVCQVFRPADSHAHLQRPLIGHERAPVHLAWGVGASPPDQRRGRSGLIDLEPFIDSRCDQLQVTIGYFMTRGHRTAPQRKEGLPVTS